MALKSFKTLECFNVGTEEILNPIKLKYNLKADIEDIEIDEDWEGTVHYIDLTNAEVLQTETGGCLYLHDVQKQRHQVRGNVEGEQMTEAQLEELRFVSGKLREIADIVDNRISGFKDKGSILFIMAIETINCAASMAAISDTIRPEEKARS